MIQWMILLYKILLSVIKRGLYIYIISFRFRVCLHLAGGETKESRLIH